MSRFSSLISVASVLTVSMFTGSPGLAETTDNRNTGVESSPAPVRKPLRGLARPRPVRRPQGTPNMAGFDRQANTEIEISSDYRFQTPQSGKFKLMCVGSSQYFNTNGTLGDKGKILKRELTSSTGSRSTPMKHLFFRNSFPNMGTLCPKFNSLNDDEKLNFWIWYFAATALDESDCGRNAYNPNDPAGTSVGELQMPASYENRKWRGLQGGPGGCDANPPPVRAQSYTHRNPPALLMAGTENSLTCGVEVLAGVLCGFYKAPAESCKTTTQAPYGHGFWKKLRRGSQNSIANRIKELPLCR